jgi:hypothetical protein
MMMMMMMVVMMVMMVVMMAVMMMPMAGIVDARHEKIRCAQRIAIGDARRSRRRGRGYRQCIGSANGDKQNRFQTIDHIAILHASLAHAGQNQMALHSDLSQGFPSLRPSCDGAKAELSTRSAPGPRRSVVGQTINMSTPASVQPQMHLSRHKNFEEPRLDNLLA